jgi:hypothetical protein
MTVRVARESNPVRWKYGVIIEKRGDVKMYCAFDRPGGERAPHDVPSERRFSTLEEVKQFIETYERKEGYAKE